MINDKYNIWIEAEEWSDGEWDVHNDNTDVIVEFDNRRWVASFFNYSNISKLVEENNLRVKKLASNSNSNHG